MRAWGALYRGYAGRFMKRTGDQQDGCALLWRESRLRLCAARDLAYRVSSRFDRDNVGQLVALHAVGESGGDGDSAGATIVVGNTHVLFNPRRGDVKLQQVATLLAAAAAMSDELSGAQGGRGVPVVVCGDFNSAPFSPIYDFLASGTISLTSSHPGPCSPHPAPAPALPPPCANRAGARAGRGAKRSCLDRRRGRRGSARGYSPCCLSCGAAGGGQCVRAWRTDCTRSRRLARARGAPSTPAARAASARPAASATAPARPSPRSRRLRGAARRPRGLRGWRSSRRCPGVLAASPAASLARGATPPPVAPEEPGGTEGRSAAGGGGRR